MINDGKGFAKEAFVVKTRYYPSIYLESVQKTKKN
jgi:hypothetical protein